MTVDELRAMDWVTATGKIDRFLQTLLVASGMQLTYAINTPAGAQRIRLAVCFEGEDTKMLIARGAELLHALESVAAGILRLSPEDHDLLSFDAENYKARRADQIHRAAEVAIRSVRTTGRPYSFPPMNSRERRMLHMELSESGLRTASSGESSRRFVVLYPVDQSSVPEASDEGGTSRLRSIRSAFRPR